MCIGLRESDGRSLPGGFRCIGLPSSTLRANSVSLVRSNGLEWTSTNRAQVSVALGERARARP